MQLPIHQARAGTAFSAARFVTPLRVAAVIAGLLAALAAGGGDAAQPAPPAAATAKPAETVRQHGTGRRIDAAYFPHQFPAPEGPIEPLPDQF